MSKRIITIFLLTILTGTLFMNTAKAASASISVSSSSSTITVGTKISVSYKISSGNALGAWDFQLVTPANFTLNSCNNSQLAHQVGVVSNSSTKTTTITCSFTAKSTGSSTFSVKNYQVEGYTEGTMSTTVTSKTIKVITQQELENSYSKNNNLKSLEISGYSLVPAFDKNTLIYNVELPAETYKVTVNGAKEDSTATVTGLGEKDLVDGLNTITIVVTAQNKSTKTYTINVTVKELEPIKVKIGEEEFTIVRKKAELKAPNEYFTESTITMDEKEVPAFINEKTNTTLIGLKDINGKIKLYIYNEEDTVYTLFRSLQSNAFILEVLDKKDNIPDQYKKQEIKINDETYTVYKLMKSSKYSLFVGQNLATGEENIYMYDEKENTVQRYNTEELSQLEKGQKEQKKTYEYIIFALASILLVTYLIILLSLIHNKKKKTIVIKDKKKEDNNIKNVDKEKKEPEELIEEMEEELDFFDRKAKKKKK